MNTLSELFALPNYKELIEEKLKELAAEQPDFIYNPSSAGRCNYNGPATTRVSLDLQVGPDCEGCIFGQAFQRLGIPKNELNTMASIDSITNCYANRQFPNWSKVQNSQDNSASWGDAIKFLDN